MPVALLGQCSGPVAVDQPSVVSSVPGVERRATEPRGPELVRVPQFSVITKGGEDFSEIC